MATPDPSPKPSPEKSTKPSPKRTLDQIKAGSTALVATLAKAPKRYAHDWHEPVAPPPVQLGNHAAFVNSAQRMFGFNEDEDRANNAAKPKMATPDVCICGNPNWEEGDADHSGKRVCLNCCVMSNSTQYEEREKVVMSQQKTQEENDAAMRHTWVLDRKANAAIYKLSVSEMGAQYTPALNRHANNRLGGMLCWAYHIREDENRIKNWFFLTDSQLKELARVAKLAVIAWVHSSDRKTSIFASNSAWFVGIALTIKAREGDGSWTVGTQELQDTSWIRGLHQHLKLFQSSTTYTREEAEELPFSESKQPNAARDAIRYVSKFPIRQARWDSMGKTKWSVFRRMDALSKLLIQAKAWPNPDKASQQKFLGLDPRVMKGSKPTIVAPLNQITLAAKAPVAIAPRSIGLKSLTGMYGKLSGAKRTTMLLPAAFAAPAPGPAVAPATPADSDADSNWDSHSDSCEEEETEAQQAAKLKAEKSKKKNAAAAKEQRQAAWRKQQVANLEATATVDAMQANMQANHAADVAQAAAAASQESNQATEPVYSDADTDSSPPPAAGAPGAGSSSSSVAALMSVSAAFEQEAMAYTDEHLDTCIATNSSLLEMLVKAGKSSDAFYQKTDDETRVLRRIKTDRESAAALSAQIAAANAVTKSAAYSPAREDDESDGDEASIIADSDVVGEYDSGLDPEPEDLDLDEDMAQAVFRAEAAEAALVAAAPADDELFASVLASVEATNPLDMPLGLATTPAPAAATPAGTKAAGAEEADYDPLAGLRWYTSKEDYQVARLTQREALDTANFRQGGAKGDRFINRWIRLHTAYRKRVKAKLERERKLQAKKDQAAEEREAKAQEAAEKRAAESAAVLQRQGQRQLKTMEKAKVVALKAAARGDMNAYYQVPTAVLGGKKRLVRAPPQAPCLKIKVNKATTAKANAPPPKSSMSIARKQ